MMTSMACNSGADCPNGYGCMAVNGQNICIKAEAPCATGSTAECIAPAACDESAQMVVGGCTLACNSAADCPQRAVGFSPWTCDAGGICRRPPDVFGPLQNGATTISPVENVSTLTRCARVWSVLYRAIVSSIRAAVRAWTP